MSSPSVSPVYGIYYSNDYVNIGQGGAEITIGNIFTPYTAMTGLSFSSGTWTNNSGSLLTLQISGKITATSVTNNCGVRINMTGGKITGVLTGNNTLHIPLTGIMTVANGASFTLSAYNVWNGSISIGGNSYPDTSAYGSVICINVLH